MFLVGPMEQLKSILTITRLISSSILLLSIFLTLLSALKWKQGILAITFSTIQFLSFICYALSYLPYAQTIFKHFFQTTCTTCCCWVISTSSFAIQLNILSEFSVYFVPKKKILFPIPWLSHISTHTYHQIPDIKL